jgi:pyridoxal phosphate enzyme (YggS family)
MVAVTKKVEPELARALAELGCLDLGENRVSELERKATFFRERGAEARWHFIGHIQRNKARRVARLADVIHSVDSARLLADLARHARDEQRQPAIFLQVKLAADAAKSGVSPAELPTLIAQARSSGLALLGLMTMAPLPTADAAATRAQARATFDELARLAATLPAEAFVDGRPRLSMGMSGDFEEAVSAGAHVLRIGSALFEGVELPSRTNREAS